MGGRNNPPSEDRRTMARLGCAYGVCFWGFDSADAEYLNEKWLEHWRTHWGMPPVPLHPPVTSSQPEQHGDAGAA